MRLKPGKHEITDTKSFFVEKACRYCPSIPAIVRKKFQWSDRCYEKASRSKKSILELLFQENMKEKRSVLLILPLNFSCKQGSNFPDSGKRKCTSSDLIMRHNKLKK